MQALQFLGVAGAIGGGLALTPALLPLGLGGLAGGGAAFGGIALGAQANKQLQALGTKLASAKGQQARDLKAQMAAIQKANAGPLAVFGAFQDLGGAFKDMFSGALTGTGRGFSGGGPGGTQNQSFLGSLLGIFKQITGFVKTLGPSLGGMFRASIPYLQAFVKFLERAALVLLPAFTKILIEFQPYLPVIVAGLMNIVKGMVGFLNAIGPSGMKAAARIFVILTEGMAAALVGLGHTINWLTENIPTWTRKIHHEWDILRHETAVIFDGARHDIAHIWDMIFNNTIGRMERGRHDIAVEWDKWRHDIAHAWDVIYNDTIGAVIRIDTGILKWFSRLPGQVLHALYGLGHSLFAFARSAFTEFLNGLKSVAGSILSWAGTFIKSLPGRFMSLLGMSPPHPGSAFYDLGAQMMHHMEAGMRSRAQGLGIGAILGGMGMGAAGAGAAQAQAIAARMLAAFGWGAGQMGSLIPLWNRESGWNRFARNPTSGAYGIPQALPPTKMPFAAQAGGGSNAAAQIAWGLSYIKGRYGSPAGAWAHEMRFGWYDRGGWLPPGLSLALNQTGRPERVGGGDTINVYVTVGHGANPRQAAQEIVKILNQGATAGVKLRTSILGPG